MTGNGRYISRVGIFDRWHHCEILESEELAVLGSELEGIGYGACWLSGARANFSVAEHLLSNTKNLVFGTGIVNIWTEGADELAAAFQRSTCRDRIVIGVGSGHAETNRAQGYARPLAAVEHYLDRLGGIPRRNLVLAALGPRMAQLAARRTSGPLAYLVTPEYTARIRAAIGPDASLYVGQPVIPDADPGRARAAARESIAVLLLARNHRANFRRLGFDDEDLDGGGSDRLLDAVMAWGDDDAIADRVREHLDAGADHVAVKYAPRTGDPWPCYRQLSPALSELQ